MVFYRRKLPHWQPEDKPLFVTWRLHGSLPVGVRPRNSARPSGSDPSQDFPADDFLAIDSQLDQARFGLVWLAQPSVARMVDDSLHEAEKTLRLYTLWAYVVMSNHVHVLLTPSVPLERITRALKGYTAREANKILQRTGLQFWQAESFDHWVRSEEELSRIVSYIEHNPVRAGLSKRPEDWPWSSARK